MDLKRLLSIIGVIASNFVPFVPALKFAELGAGLASKIVDELTASGTVITDENGNPLSNEQLAEAVQGKWDEAIAGVTRISERADTQLGRTE